MQRPRRRGPSRRSWSVALALAAVALAMPASPPAEAKFLTGLGGRDYTSPDSGVRDEWFDDTRAAEADVVRINVAWRLIAEGVPLDPSDPADPAYAFSGLDAAIEDAAQRDLEVLLTVYLAPDFAEGAGRPADVRPGTWRPNAQAYGQFAEALATRYSGEFSGLPRVRFFEAWNEPNLSLYLTPQWSGRSLASAQLYRDLVNEFEQGVHAAHPRNEVIAGSTAPYGDPRGGERTRPLAFLREFLCVRREGNGLTGTACSRRPSFDVLSHHPINFSGGPRISAVHRDDASTPDLRHVREILRAAERARKIRGGAGRHQLWVTELWWETSPPASRPFIINPNPRKHARWIADALYLLWKQGAKVVINVPLRDGGPDSFPLAGLYFNDGQPKPALEVFRFPFVTERRSKDTLLAWGKSPSAGKLKIQRRSGGGWRTVERLNADDGKIFTAKLRSRGGGTFRATVAGKRSPVWLQRR